MKALTLCQPWASLMAIGAKRIETRGWYCRHRGPLAIHASKRMPRDVMEWLQTAGRDDLDALRIREVLRRAGYLNLRDLPCGAVLSTVEVVDCKPTGGMDKLISRDELAFGDYRPGRYAILTNNLRPFPEPIPAKGALGLWEWEGGVSIAGGRRVLPLLDREGE